MTKDKTRISGVSRKLSKSISQDIRDEYKGKQPPLFNKKIGISVSDSEDYKQLGYSEMHQKDITIEMARYLLANGAEIVYGGDLRREGYTLAFSELAFQYRLRKTNDSIHGANFFGWPIHLKLQNSDRTEFKKNRFKVVEVACPDEVPSQFRDSFLDWGASLENKYYWAKSMSKMRNQMIDNCHGRIALGGKLKDYRGFYPGIIEEAYLAIKKRKPLYLIGAFGGASLVAIRALKGEKSAKLTAELMDWFPEMEEPHSEALRRKDHVKKLSELLAELNKVGIRGLAKLNRLSVEQNEVLFETKYFYEIIFNVLVGLKKSFGRK